MIKKILENKNIILVILIGLILSIVISYVIFSSNQTINVWVPNSRIQSGEIITQDMIKRISLPAKTPGDFLKDSRQIVGHRLLNTVEENQLLYSTNFISSWDKHSQDMEIPDDYVITSVLVEDSKACGGLIVAGDTVDILGVSTGSRVRGFEEKAQINGRENIGTYVYYILANVKIINTNSALSEAHGNDLSQIIDSKGNTGSYYIIALSYEDLKKLRQAEATLDLWLNISPKQNLENDPLIEQMVGQSWSGLHDAQKQVQNRDGTPKEGVPQVSESEDWDHDIGYRDPSFDFESWMKDMLETYNNDENYN